ncbi:glycosyltransferase [Streptomyces chrestomyceticus]|uniref:glycosyltransferase n=1 Tax=Streptomyces chrestomyceticus TaxID=68185 RepID=UPI0035A8EC44
MSVKELRALLAPVSGPGRCRFPSPSPFGRPVRLTVGICTYDDFDGAWFTIASLLVHHAEVMRDAEILLIDNHPEGPAAKTLKGLSATIPQMRYVPLTTMRSTAVKHMVFPLAQGEVVVVLDSHVLLAPGALQAVVDYFEERPECRDLVQGPLLYDDAVTVCGTHFTAVWSDGMHGQWAVDPRADDPAGEPFDIPMQGTGAFACRRQAWPGFNSRFHGFGCEEGYLHEKIRRAGGRTVCLPAMRWVHRFERPAGAPYQPTWEDQLRNYLIAWDELGWEPSGILEHYAGELSREVVEVIHRRVRVELGRPFAAFDGVVHPLPPQPRNREANRNKAESFDESVGAVPSSVRGVPAVAHRDARVAALLTYRRCLAYAALHGWRSVLVTDSPHTLGQLTHEILKQAARTGNVVVYPRPGGRASADAREPLLPSAVGYWDRAHLQALDALPATPKAAERWIERHGHLGVGLACAVGTSAAHKKPPAAPVP